MHPSMNPPALGPSLPESLIKGDDNDNRNNNNNKNFSSNDNSNNTSNVIVMIAIIIIIIMMAAAKNRNRISKRPVETKDLGSIVPSLSKGLESRACSFVEFRV